MTPEQENLCRQALDGLKTVTLTGPFPYGPDDLMGVLEQHGLPDASINLLQETATGFTRPGLAAVAALAKTFRPNLGTNSRRASNVTLAKVIAAEMMKAWSGRVSPSLAQSDFDQLQTAIDEWFAALNQVREHVVPCTLFPYAIPSFTIGPVTFRHFSELPTDGFGITRDEFWPAEPSAWKQRVRNVWAAIRNRPIPRPEIGGFLFSTLARFAIDRAAPWMAFVRVTGRAQTESIRAADFAADIALAVIQLVSPGDDMRSIGRASARTAPAWRVDVFRTEGGDFNTGSRNQTSALARSPELVAIHIKQVESAFTSMGQRLGAFLDASSSVPDLDEAWCNAAYWYHEALAETLETVAVAKLETSIEVLFRAESMTGSKRRLEESIDAFFGLSITDRIGSNSQVTVAQFIESITTARSRVLHGTWPTLHFDLPVNKVGQTVSYGDVELLTRTLLLNFSIQLDQYVKAGNPIDKSDAFLSWIKANRS